jgi:hypothetical protein
MLILRELWVIPSFQPNNENKRSDIMELREYATTALVVGGVYLGMLGIIRLFAETEPAVDATADRTAEVARSAENYGACSCGQMECSCEDADYSTKTTTLPWDEMRIPHAGMVARNMTVRERSNVQMLQLFGGVPPVTVSDMTSLITGGRL